MEFARPNTSARFTAVYLTLFRRFQLRAKTQQKPEIRLIDTRNLVLEIERRKQPPNPTSPSIAHKSAHFPYRYAARQQRKADGAKVLIAQ